MFRNNQTSNLLIIFGGILVSLLIINMGTSVDEVFSSTGGSNSSATPQTLNFTEALNLLRSMQEKSNGNSTELNMLLIDEMERRKIINEEEKKELTTYMVGFNKIKPTRNITDMDTRVISLLDNIETNSSNPIATTLKSTLKNVVPDIGTNTATLISNLANNTLPGLPVTIEDIGDFAARTHLDSYSSCTAGMVGGALLGVPGLLAGGLHCALV
jgi:hypothetical protein